MGVLEGQGGSPLGSSSLMAILPRRVVSVSTQNALWKFYRIFTQGIYHLAHDNARNLSKNHSCVVNAR